MCNTEGPPSPIIDTDLNFSIILDDRIIAAMPVSNGKIHISSICTYCLIHLLYPSKISLYKLVFT